MSNSLTVSDTFDFDLAGLLTDLSDVQRELLTVLGEKRSFLAAADVSRLTELQPREEALIGRLQECQQRRTALLAEANARGCPMAR